MWRLSLCPLAGPIRPPLLFQYIKVLKLTKRNTHIYIYIYTCNWSGKLVKFMVHLVTSRQSSERFSNLHREPDNLGTHTFGNMLTSTMWKQCTVASGAFRRMGQQRSFWKHSNWTTIGKHFSAIAGLTDLDKDVGSSRQRTWTKIWRVIQWCL